MIACLFQKYPENFSSQLFIILQQFTHEICYFKQFLLSFLFINKTVRLYNLKTRTAMNAEISVFVILVEAIIYLLLYNIHGCTFKKIWAEKAANSDSFFKYFLVA